MDRTLTLVSGEEIMNLAGPGAYSRGSRYAEQGHVLRVVWHDSDQELVGDVAGSTGLYRTTVGFEDFEDGEPGEVVFAECTCPVGTDCKHCVATLLVNNERIVEGSIPGIRYPAGPATVPDGLRPATARPPEPTPAWQQQFDRIVEASHRAARSAGTEQALALGFELHRPPAHHYFQPKAPARLKASEITDEAEPELHIRPLVPGAKSNWIKGQAGWHWFSSRSQAARFDAEQFEWFYRLASLDDLLGLSGYASSAATIRLDSFASPHLWDLLAQASDLGIPLVSTDKQIAVHLADAASFHIDVTRSEPAGPQSPLLVAPEVMIDDRSVPSTTVRPIGLTGVYSLTMTGKSKAAITLAPLSAPLTPAQKTMLGPTSATEIPVEGQDEFFDRILPLLRTPTGHGTRTSSRSEHRPGPADRTGSGRTAPGRTETIISSDGSVELPETCEPHLNLHITFETGPSRSRQKSSPPTTARLDWSWTYYSPQRTCPLIAHDSEYTGRQDARDPKFERTTLADLRGIAGDLARTPSETLTGIDVATFVTRTLPRIDELGSIAVTIAGSDEAPEFQELDADPSITMRTEARDDSDWFDLGIDVTIDGHEIPFAELFTALATEQSHLLLNDGSYFSLDHHAFDTLRELLAEAAALDGFTPENPQISRYQTALYEDLEELADETAEDPAWADLMAGLREIDTIAEVDVPTTLNADLRPYQVEGFRWLTFLLEHRLGGILADDMGLGKTLQTLALIDHDRQLRNDGKRDSSPFLVVAPTSVVANWVLEARKFTPHLQVTALSATAKKRGSTVAEATAGSDIVVTSYAVMRLDAEEFAGLDWAGVVFDEAQFMKNSQAKTHRAARRIAAPFRLAITGTPMENSLNDVWSLAAVTAPGLFPNAKRFRDDYVRPIESGDDPERMAKLRRRLRPFMLRRTKDLVAADLPEKQEQVLGVELEAQHRRLYDTVLQRERKQVLGLLGDFEKNRFAIFRSLTLLRMLALDPGIVDEYADSGIGSSKLTVLLEHLTEVGTEGHRALVFSQFTSYLRAVAAELDAQGIAYEYLDGSTRDRTKVIESFRTGSAAVFLISLKAGGFGLTLTEADYVFLLDPWWNPAAESQAIDRTHRIGQTRSVMVYRLVAENTIEEKVLALQQKKAELFTALMDDGEAFSEVISAADIQGLLDG
jgi:superfamily II DNA or RNA helicase